MKKKKRNTILIVVAVAVAVGVAVILPLGVSTWLTSHPSDSDDDGASAADTVSVPSFNADSAYASIVKQCAFGPRVPGSDAQLRCADYIGSELKRMGYTVILQRTTVKAYDGTPLRCINIFATTDTAATDRILVTAHWDSRPWADHDPDESKRREPVLAANDGASGVAVIIELARAMQKQRPGIAVDFACLDAEDYGTPEWDKASAGDDDARTWCLGTQYFAANPPLPGYMPRYAINLDMVGGRGAKFMQEGFSKQYAPGVVSKVWAFAAEAGYSDFFPQQDGGYVTDDHLPLNEIAAIPTIDVIPCYKDYETSFGPTWHTTHDTPDNIDRNTLKAVGQTMLHVIYNER